MKKLLWLALLVAVLLAGWALLKVRRARPEVPFARVERSDLVSVIVTNGRIEPLEWAAVAAEQAGLVRRVHAERGQRVKAGEVLVELDAATAEAELAAARARLAQVQAEIARLEQGGRAAELAALDAEIEALRPELAAAEQEKSALERLAARQAATRTEADAAGRRAEKLAAQLDGLRKRRLALVDSPERQAARARLDEAEAALESARLRLEKTLLRSPLAGTVYEADLRPGAFVAAGQTVAKVGRLDRVLARVFVDEPELGRLARGQAVLLGWDALPGRRWEGSVERLPSEITVLGSRQVGEVVCRIENPGGELLPGTNVNVEIRTEAARSALSMPREALRRRNGQTGVFTLNGDRLAWQPVELGISTVTRVQILKGLNEGDAVALPTDVGLAEGLEVRPVFRP